MFKEEQRCGKEGLYSITWSRSVVLVLLFLTCLCILVCEGLAHYPLHCRISCMELRNTILRGFSNYLVLSPDI